jgi:hypothetical protein
MTSGRPGGLPVSIRQRLLNLSRERRESFQRVLDRFALERFLYRLGRSPPGGPWPGDEKLMRGKRSLDL